MVLFCCSRTWHHTVVGSATRSVQTTDTVEPLLFRTYTSARPFRTARVRLGITDLGWPVLVTPSAASAVNEMLLPSDFELALKMGREAIPDHSAFCDGKELIFIEHPLYLIALPAF